jgi:hypothetical protein
MRSACVLALLAAVSLAATTAPAVAGKGGNPGKGGKGRNSAAAHRCHHGGWRNWVRADQTPFKNTGACVSYAAHGGTLTRPKSAAQRLCESLGGVFAAGSDPTTLWFCTYQWSSAAFNALANRCFADGGNAYGIVSGNAGGARKDVCRNL